MWCKKIEVPQSLKDKAVVFDAPKDLFARPPELKDQMRTAIKEDAVKREEEWKTKNAVPFKGITRAIETRIAPEPAKTSARVRAGRTLRQELRHEHIARVEKARAHVPDKFKAPAREVEKLKTDKIFIRDLEDVRARRREDQKGASLRSKFKASESPPQDTPPTISNEEHSELRRSRTEATRPNVDSKYRASDYTGEGRGEPQSDSNKGLRGNWSEEASDSKANEKPRMSHGFNDQAASSDLNDDPNLSNDEDGFDHDDL